MVGAGLFSLFFIYLFQSSVSYKWSLEEEQRYWFFHQEALLCSLGWNKLRVLDELLDARLLKLSSDLFTKKMKSQKEIREKFFCADCWKKYSGERAPTLSNATYAKNAKPIKSCIFCSRSKKNPIVSENLRKNSGKSFWVWRKKRKTSFLKFIRLSFFIFALEWLSKFQLRLRALEGWPHDCFNSELLSIYSRWWGPHSTMDRVLVSDPMALGLIPGVPEVFSEKFFR